MGDVLEARGLTVRFGGLQALRNLSLKIEAGELVGIIGPNGSGKTTFVNAVTGTVPVTSGAVTLGGRRLNGLPPFRISRLGVGRTFQIMRPFGDMTVLDNVMVAALHARGASLREASAAASAQLEFVGLADRAHVRPDDLPLPDRKKLELAQALVQQPRLLFLDEVNAGLSPPDVQSVMALVRGVNARGVTVVVVEHVMRVIAGLCTRVVVLHHGERIADGPCERVMTDPAVVTAYLGRRYAQRAVTRT
jgi:branched-chain amino acid transport system ATP-binding protein